MNRRHFLRSSGVTLALPLLESFGFRRFASAAPAQPPLRFGFIYTPNGYFQDTFVPKTTGRDWEILPALEPLKSVKDDVTFITGLDRQFVPGTGVHAQCGSCWLTSSAPDETLDGGFPTNTTLDQIIAKQIGRDTALPSLELSCNDLDDNKETRYFESISWYGPGYAASTEKNPREVFGRLFGTAQDGPMQSILDTVLDDAKSVRRRLGGDDQEKLDEYLESVRFTEQRIQRAEAAANHIGKPPIPEPKGIPERRGDYIKLMGDLMVLAFQNDLTRVATLLVGPERWDSPRMFHEISDKPLNHHVLTHTKGDEAKAVLTTIDRFHVDLFRYLTQRLKDTPDGNGTLFDHCAIAFGSGISDGNSHNYADLQVLLAGRAGGQIQPGVHHHYKGERPLADLWLSMAAMAGGKRERFADGHRILSELG